MGLLLHDLTKHQAGKHDQSSHGAWAQGRSVSDLVGESIRRAGVGRQLDVDAMKIGLPSGHMDAATPQEDLAKIVDAQGWNRPAPLLSDEEFEEAYATGEFTIVYRTGPIGLEQGILNGTPYIGEGLYGMGTYVTDDPNGVIGYVKYEKGRSVVPMLVPTVMLESAAKVEPETAGSIVPPQRYLREAAAAGSGALFTRSQWDYATRTTEYVIYNTSALLVGQPSEFPDEKIPEYIYDKPQDEPLLWERFEKMVEGWEDGPYYALVDGKAVPVEFDADVTKHQAGSGHDQKSHGSWARGLASIGPFERLPAERVADLFPQWASLSDLHVWYDAESNVAITSPAPIDGIGDLSGLTGTELAEGQRRPRREDLEKALDVLARLQENAPVRDTSIILLGNPVADYEGTIPRGPWGTSPNLAGFTAKPGVASGYVPHPQIKSWSNVMEVSLSRASRLGDLSPYAFQKRDPLAYVLTHEWGHVVAQERYEPQVREREWGGPAPVSPAAPPLSSPALGEMGRVIGDALGRDDVNIEEYVTPRFPVKATVGQAETVGWTAYGMSSYEEAFAESFAAWALGGSSEVRPMVEWGERNFGFGEFVTLPDGTIVPMDKAVGVVGIGCTFDPAVGPIMLTAEDMVKHQAGAGHDQKSHGVWARGRAAKVTSGIDGIFRIGNREGLALREGRDLSEYLLRTQPHFRREVSALTEATINDALNQGMSPREIFGDEVIDRYRDLFRLDSDEAAARKAISWLSTLRDYQHDKPVLGSVMLPSDIIAQISEGVIADTLRIRGFDYRLEQLKDPETRKEAKRIATAKVAERLPSDSVSDAIEYVGQTIAPLKARGADGMTTYERARLAYENDGIVDGREVEFRVSPRGVVVAGQQAREPRLVVEAGFGLPPVEGSVVGKLSDPKVREAVENAARSEAARLLIDEWSATSNRSVAAQQIQEAARAEFGLEAGESSGGSFAPEGFDSPLSERLARSFVRAQYEATQQMLAEEFPDTTHFVLYRGGDSTKRYDEADRDAVRGALADIGPATGVTLQMRPLASFSGSFYTARGFADAGASFAAAVPRERIFSTPFTGNGALFESEMVVLGGRITGNVDEVFADVDDLPLGATEFIMVDGQSIPIGKAALSKHQAGSGHDQKSHGSWARGRTPTMDNTNQDGPFMFDEVREKVGLGDAGIKDKNAKDVAARLVSAGASPDDLLALVMADTGGPHGVGGDKANEMLIDSTMTLSGLEIPSYTGVAGVGTRFEAINNAWPAARSALLNEELPDDVTVLRLQTNKVGWREIHNVVITRDPDKYRDKYPTQTLREGGEWQDGAVEALGYHAVDATMHEWAASAQGQSSDALAAAMMEELGVSVSVPQSTGRHQATGEIPEHLRPEGKTHRARKAIVRAMYDNTQEQLADLFPDSEYFALYRGAGHGDVVNRSEETIDESTMIAGGGATAMHRINYKPLSSWSTDSYMAERFSEVDFGEKVAGAIVPRERIFSTAFSGNGAFGESEFVVIGGAMDVAVTIPEYEESVRLNPEYLRLRLRSGAVAADEFIMIDGQPVPLMKAATFDITKEDAGG